VKESYKAIEAALKQYSRIAIIIKGSPDPDALASSFVLKKICEKLSIKAQIIATSELSLPQNRLFVKKTGIPVEFVKSMPESDKFDAYAVLDHQSSRVEGLTGAIPCVLHIDHHAKVSGENHVDYEMLREDAGSTSTMLALLLRDSGLEFDEETMRSMSTALAYGIQTDTDRYMHADRIDYDAVSYITDYVDSDLIMKISNVPLSDKAISLLWKALENQFMYKDWLISGIGFVGETHRDSIAIIADFLLQKMDVPTVIVFAVIEKKDHQGLMLDASFRSIRENLNLNDIIKEITTKGGGRKYKGAFQVNLDYFVHAPDRDLLWQLVQQTTVEILKKRRDGIYMTELRGFYNRIRDRINGMFNGED